MIEIANILEGWHHGDPVYVWATNVWVTLERADFERLARKMVDEKATPEKVRRCLDNQLRWEPQAPHNADGFARCWKEYL